MISLLLLVLAEWAVLTTAELTDTQRTEFLDTHNTYRAGVSPPAADMRKMIWSNDLEEMAQIWADGCDFVHGNPTFTPKPFATIGQNLFVTSRPSVDIKSAVESWYSEVDAYTYESNSCSAVCGHYTQVVWAKSYAVGCAIKTGCDPLKSVSTFNTGSLVVCNYGPAGNFVGQHPYTTGTACSSCPSGLTCDNNLCANSTVTNEGDNSNSTVTNEGDNSADSSSERHLLSTPFIIIALLAWIFINQM